MSASADDEIRCAEFYYEKLVGDVMNVCGIEFFGDNSSVFARILHNHVEDDDVPSGGFFDMVSEQIAEYLGKVYAVADNYETCSDDDTRWLKSIVHVMYCKTMHKSKNVLEADPSDIAMTMKLTTSTPTTSATEHNGADIDLDDKRCHRFEVHATIGDEEVVYFVYFSPV